MNPAQRNHNPCNLRFAGQKEATGKDDQGFAIFAADPAGFRAAHAQIRLDASRGLTLEQFIVKFAPPTENDTSQYLVFVISELHALPFTPLKQVSPYALAGVMAQEEGFYNKEGL
jgi:hypothetical protein